MQAPTRKSMTSSSGLSPGSPFQFLTNTLTGQPTGLHSISRTPTSDTSINCKPTTPPDPYVWNESFKVAYPRLDQEHVGLFEGMLAVEKDLGSKQKLDHLKKVVRDHFYYEEEEFCNGDEDIPADYCPRHKHKHAKFSEKLAAMHAPVAPDDIKWAQDWLAQHIKNSDFGYKTNLVHPVPEPYVWDNTFAVDFSRLDSEPDVLFTNILAISQ